MNRHVYAFITTLSLVTAGEFVSAQDKKPPKSNTSELKNILDRKELITALEQNESIASTTSLTAVSYAALCKGAAYAFILAEPKSEDSLHFAKRGYKLADSARMIQPSNVEGHYKYALCFGIYLREYNLAAITGIDELLHAAQQAVALDETYDRGGPHRFLARFYAEAPHFLWFGPGDPALARKHLQKLLEIAGDDTENKLTVVRVHIKLGEKEQAKELLQNIDKNLNNKKLREERNDLEQLLNE